MPESIRQYRIVVDKLDPETRSSVQRIVLPFPTLARAQRKLDEYYKIDLSDTTRVSMIEGQCRKHGWLVLTQDAGQCPACAVERLQAVHAKHGCLPVVPLIA